MHAENVFKDARGPIESGNTDRDRTQTANLMLGRDGALFPWVDASGPTIINETKTLALGIFKIKHQPPVSFSNGAMTHILTSKVAPPPFEGVFSRYSQPRADNAVGASLLRCRWPNEEGQVSAWTPLPIRVKKMVGSDIVLIDGLLDQTHPENIRVEMVVTARVRRNCCEMVDTVELHETPPYTIRISLPTRTIKKYRGKFQRAKPENCQAKRQLAFVKGLHDDLIAAAPRLMIEDHGVDHQLVCMRELAH
jgi:hypothetical protein